MASRRSRATRRSTWRLEPTPRADQRPSRARWASTEREPRRSPRTGRGTARSCCRRKRCCSGTANWPRSMAIRPTGLWPRRGSMAQRQVHEPDRSIAQQAVTYARDHLFERSAVQDRRDHPASGAQPRHGGDDVCPGAAGVRRSEQREASSARSIMPERRTAVHDRRHAAHGTRDRRHGCRKAISAGSNDPMLVDPRIRIATEDRHPELNASQRQAVDQIFLSPGEDRGLGWRRRGGEDDDAGRHP